MDVDDQSMAPDFWPVDPATYDEDNPLLHPDYTVVVGLNLYKVSVGEESHCSYSIYVSSAGLMPVVRIYMCVMVCAFQVQQSIYLLDFQRVEGDAFSFMNLSALIITQLKTLSAASRQVSHPNLFIL